jgi:predicted transcriptional regulator
MTQKLSPQKLSKMLALYLEGYSQSQIADKLKINQATVSMSVGKFSALAEQNGLDAAAKEYGIMDQVKALHSLAAELKEAKLTVEEAKVGLKMVVVLQKCGVKQEDYQNLVQACTKMKDEGFISSAIKLNQLQNTTRMTPEEIITKTAGASQQLKQTQAQLQSVTDKLNASKEELIFIEKQKKEASQGLAAHMKQVGVDTNRLKLVEALAMALKAAGIPDKEIQHFIQCQQLLNKAGLALDTLTAILEKAKVATFHDGGKELLKTLSEYDGLFQAAKTLQIKVEGLSKQVTGLEEQAKLKGKIEGEVAKLKTEKASLEAHVAGLHDQKDELDHIKTEVGALGEKKAVLLKEVNGLEMRKKSLAGDIKTEEEKVSNLKELKRKYEELLHDLAEVEARVNRDKKRWEVFEGFLGLVQSSSMAELQKSVMILPKLLEEVQEGTYSPEFLKGFILKELAGPTFQVLKCVTCQAHFYIDKPPPVGGYQCPIGGFGHSVVVDKDALALLKAALSPSKQQPIVLQSKISISKPPKTKDSSGG